MPNIVAISKDQRLLRDIEKHCQDTVGDDLRFAGFQSGAEFEALYFKEKKEGDEVPQEEDSEEGVGDLRLFSEVHMIVVCEDSVDGKISEFAPRCLNFTRRMGYWPKDNRTRIMALRYEEDDMDKVALLTPSLEDLLLLPLDRLLFMQKLEIFLNLPSLTSPSFLFSQETHDDMELSKIVILERLNDCALAIRNRSPLKPGVRGKFYLKPPGSKEIIRFYGKVFKNEPHPDLPGESLVYFFFFGVRKKEVTVIRKWLSSDPKYHGILDDSPSEFSYNPDDIFLSNADKESQSVAIVDRDENHGKGLVELIERRMDRVSAFNYTYALFHDIGLGESEVPEGFSPNPTEMVDLPGAPFTIEVERDSKNLLDISFEPTEFAKFCGHPSNEIFLNTQNIWWNIFDLPLNESAFKDALFEKKSSKVLFVKNSVGDWQGFLVHFDNLDENRIRLQFEPANSNVLLEKIPEAKKLNKLSALVIDTAFVSQDFDPWLTGLIEKTIKAGMIKSPEELKIILMSTREDHLNEEWLKCDNIKAFILKPVDQKAICVTLAEILGNRNTVYTFKNLGWIKPSMRLHLSKPAKLDHLGEFGATINTSTPFKEGSFFFLRKGIFDEAPNECLTARVYKTEPHPSEDGRYLVHTTYFGINDHFLKHARNFMRENYAQSKAKNG